MFQNPQVLNRIFPMGDPPDYEPPPEASIGAIAAREGKNPEEVLYDYCSATRAASSSCCPTSTTPTVSST